MAAAAGLINHPVDNIQVAPAALFVMRVATHQAVTRLRATLLGKIVFQQLHHSR